MTQVQISTLIDTYQQDHAKGLLTQQQLLGLVWRLDRMSAHCSQSTNAGTQ
jgi:ribosomal protein S15P/S13E